jgi:orotate phosphoribosyltransferase
MMTKSWEIDLAKALLQTKALQFGMFTLSGGKLSPYYIDLRVLPSFPDAFHKAIGLMVESAREISNVQKIGGIPTGGLPWASVIAYSLMKPLVYARKEVKHHGRERMVEGILLPGENILLIDDVITTGKNILTAAQTIRNEGGVVENALVLLDRQEKGMERLAEQGIHLTSVTKISIVAEHLHNMDAISKHQFEELMAQLGRDVPVGESNE